jgi:uncharacterized protein YaaQ
MKLTITVLPSSQADETAEALLLQGYRITRLACTGGLLRQGNTTLLTGVKDKELDPLLQIIQEKAPEAQVFVLPLERYERF